MQSTLERSLTVRALEMAIAQRRPAPGLIHHSDRNVQYACGDYQTALNEQGMIPSMSRKGDCWDNAPKESFFGTLKCELGLHGIRLPPGCSVTFKSEQFCNSKSEQFTWYRLR